MCVNKLNFEMPSVNLLFNSFLFQNGLQSAREYEYHRVFKFQHLNAFTMCKQQQQRSTHNLQTHTLVILTGNTFPINNVE